MKTRTSLFGLLAAALCSTVLLAQRGASSGQWPTYGGDPGSTKYAPLDQINRQNVKSLRVAWRWGSPDDEIVTTNRRSLPMLPAAFKSTPIMVNGILYIKTSLSQAAAIDAATGKGLWVFDPETWRRERPANTGFNARGVAYWSDGKIARIFLPTGDVHLWALDAKTGRPIDSFGQNGSIDATLGLRRPVPRQDIQLMSAPLVVGDVVVIGSVVSDGPRYQLAPPGDVRGFDVRTGKELWQFHTIPQAGEAGNETWLNESWRYTGAANAWGLLSADPELGYLYIPTGTPTNDYYGGHRQGDNLFAESLICLDAKTGKEVWHFQFVHHGLWDYDATAAPLLLDIVVDGRPIKAVAVVTKQAFTYVFDRVTGKPVWRIEERPVPPSDVDGEHAWPTQPVPTKPPALTEQGVTLDDAFDLTPALKMAAQEQLKKFQIGPLFTPPSLQGTVQRPGIIGGANWGGAAFDPETGLLFVKTSNQAHIGRVGKPDRSSANPLAAENDADYARIGSTNAEFMNGLPLLKPPYGHLVAVDLNRGEIKWRVPFGDTAALRHHAALKDVTLPARLGVAGAPGVIATKGGLIFGGGGDAALYAFEKATGAEVWNAPLARRTNGTPMTYRSRAGRQFVVVATGAGEDAALVAFALGPAKIPSTGGQ